MRRATFATTNVGGSHNPEITDLVLSVPEDDERGWRAFLVSWKLGAILAAACVLGLLAIFAAANPFASATVSEQVSSAVGNPATCTQLAAGGASSDVYRCRIDTGKQSVSRCFVLAAGDVKQYVSNRRGC
jgi:hypothetical protein